jgi:hypothetical protein
MTTFAIVDRRKRSHTPRTLERRAPGRDDARVIQFLEDLGIDKVKTDFARGAFNSRYAVAKRWLEDKSGAENRKTLMYAVAHGLGLALILITGWLVY